MTKNDPVKKYEREAIINFLSFLAILYGPLLLFILLCKLGVL